MKSAGTDVVQIAGILENIVANCETCRKYAKPAPRPVVGFSLANDYNHTVAMDLHQLEPSLWYLHIIDEFSRFSAGCITNSKQSSKIVKKFMQCWISIHGAPKRLFSDLGGEFDSAEMKDMSENFNIVISTTAAYSPWSNGLLERHNQTLTEILLKLKSDYALDWETALNWAIMAKNSLQNVHGYSPYQIVFGRNPNIPTTLTDKPPALEGTTISEVVKNNINGLHAARQAFIKAESSEKIRRALRKQIRPTPDLCSPGDKVFYKRPDNQEWRGPGVVIGQDGSVVFVRHGGMLVRVHKCRLRLCNSPLQDKTPNETPETSETSDSQNYNGETSDDEEFTETSEVVTRKDPIPNPIASIKPGNIIRYNQKGNDDQIQAEIISRAGKATGKNKNWFNVKIKKPENLEGEEMSVDLGKVSDLNVTEPPIGAMEQDTIMMVESGDFDEAKKRELDSWKQNNVFTEIEDAGQKCISTRWVCSLKNTPNGAIPKARLVARGFEEPNDDIQKYSPTCAHESLRLIMALTAQYQWSLHSMDIKTAFLQGQPMDREVYIRPPKESLSNKIWRLNKCVYGLSDASLQWYNKVKSVMIESGGVMSQMDPTVFYWIGKTGTLAGVLACHVDDFIWSGDQTFNNIISKIRRAFKIGKEDSKAFKYCGIELNCSGLDILVDQNRYTDSISPISIDCSRIMEKESPLTKIEIHSLRSKIGQLLWLAHQSRPDLLFDICSLATNINHSTIKDLITANKIIAKAKASKLSLKYQHLGSHDQLQLMIFSDAALGNLPDGGSQGGYIIFLTGASGKVSPIWWNSKKIRRIVHSTLSAETISMSEAIDTAVFISTLFGELTTGITDPKCLPIICVTDCKSLLEAVKSTKSVKEKRLRIEISGIKELMENGQIEEFQWQETGRQLADCLTKRGASPWLLRSVLQQASLNDCN